MQPLFYAELSGRAGIVFVLDLYCLVWYNLVVVLFVRKIKIRRKLCYAGTVKKI